MTTIDTPGSEADITATALAEYIASRWGETGAYFGTDTDDGWRKPGRLLLRLTDAGASCADAAHNAYLVPAVRAALEP